MSDAVGVSQWSVSDAVEHSDLSPLDMANNIDDGRVRERIAWIDGFGRAYAASLDGGRDE